MNHLLLNFGLKKNFQFGRTRVQIRIEALYATSYTLCGVANVSTQRPRASASHQDVGSLI